MSILMSSSPPPFFIKMHSPTPLLVAPDLEITGSLSSPSEPLNIVRRPMMVATAAGSTTPASPQMQSHFSYPPPPRANRTELDAATGVLAGSIPAGLDVLGGGTDPAAALVAELRMSPSTIAHPDVDYPKILHATIAIQRAFRLRRKNLNGVSQDEAARKVQSVFRGFQVRRMFAGMESTNAMLHAEISSKDVFLAKSASDLQHSQGVIAQLGK
ncbi:hypothetical protein BDK51DRAFT_51545, partial [Blyttiomyces helicus]